MLASLVVGASRRATRTSVIASLVSGRSLSTSPSPFALFVSVEIDPAHTEEFLKAMTVDAAGSRTEAACHRFDLLKDRSNPNKYYFYEVYHDDGPALDVHKATPHYKAWADFKSKYGVIAQEVIKSDAIDFTL